MPRAKVREGAVPSADKKIAQQKKKNEQTFQQITMIWHADHKRRLAHYAKTISRRLEMSIFPDIGDILIDQIATRLKKLRHGDYAPRGEKAADQFESDAGSGG